MKLEIRDTVVEFSSIPEKYVKIEYAIIHNIVVKNCFDRVF